MDPSYISPFIHSVQNVFSTMLQMPVTVGEPSIKSSAEPAHDVSGIIGMSGDVAGSIVLSFDSETADAIVSLFTGEKIDASSPDFADAVGELVNMISGGAKAKFPGGKSVSISCPSVIVGKGHSVAPQTDIPCVIIPGATDCGEIAIEVAIREQPTPAGAGAGAASASGGAS